MFLLPGGTPTGNNQSLALKGTITVKISFIFLHYFACKLKRDLDGYKY